jgi:hypothetical protein
MRLIGKLKKGKYLIFAWKTPKRLENTKIYLYISTLEDATHISPAKNRQQSLMKTMTQIHHSLVTKTPLLTLESAVLKIDQNHQEIVSMKQFGLTRVHANNLRIN